MILGSCSRQPQEGGTAGAASGHPQVALPSWQQSTRSISEEEPKALTWGSPLCPLGASPGGRGVGSAQEPVSGLVLTGQLPGDSPGHKDLFLEAPFPQAWGSSPGQGGLWVRGWAPLAAGRQTRPGCGAGTGTAQLSGSCRPCGEKHTGPELRRAGMARPSRRPVGTPSQGHPLCGRPGLPPLPRPSPPGEGPPWQGCLTIRDVPQSQGFVSPIILEAVIPQISCSQCFPTGELIPYSSSPGRGPLSLWVKKWGPRRHRDSSGGVPCSLSTPVSFCVCLWLSCF